MNITAKGINMKHNILIINFLIIIKTGNK